MPPRPHPPFKSCPCGSGRSYAACCRPAHDGSVPPPTPEALMRARYSAFALGDEAEHPRANESAIHVDVMLGGPEVRVVEPAALTAQVISRLERARDLHAGGAS